MNKALIQLYKRWAYVFMTGLPYQFVAGTPTPNPAPRGGELSKVPVFERAAARSKTGTPGISPFPLGRGQGDGSSGEIQRLLQSCASGRYSSVSSFVVTALAGFRQPAKAVTTNQNLFTILSIPIISDTISRNMGNKRPGT